MTTIQERQAMKNRPDEAQAADVIRTDIEAQCAKLNDALREAGIRGSASVKAIGPTLWTIELTLGAVAAERIADALHESSAG